MTQPYTIAAYYFPQYHHDPRNTAWHGEGWTEWELLKRAEPRFPGHQQPKVPLWGYEDEADPRVMEKKIDAAADHGITTFIYDWYWYSDGPFLQRGLEEGFLQARNRDRLQFALMWANHDWINIFPLKRQMPTTTLATGNVSRAQFDAAVEYLVSHYFTHPAYWCLDGKPYFSIYELMRLVESLGGIKQTRAALDHLRDRAREAGLPGLHLNAVVWGVQILPGETAIQDPNALVDALGFDSVTSYVWSHNTPLTTFPTVSYPTYARTATQDWQRFTDEYAVPYFPNVTMGWDPSPRTVQSDTSANIGYPFMSTLVDNTPEAFGEALAQAKTFLDLGRTQPSVLTINAWNEWTEGSYLEPDTLYGYGYLEAIRRVFGSNNSLLTSTNTLPHTKELS